MYDLRWITGSVVCVVLLAVKAVWAETIPFSAEVGEQIRSLRADVVYLDNVPYVSLPGLLRQAGGASRIQDQRIDLLLEGTRAQAVLNDRRVTVPKGEISLRYPILGRMDEALIALEDVEFLFSQAFGVTVTREKTASAPEPPKEIATEPTPSTAATPDAEASVTEGAPAALEVPPPTIPNEITLSPTPVAPPAYGTSAPSETPAPAGTPVPPLGQGVIVLDAGHGGLDPGVVATNGLMEKDVTLNVVQKMKAIAEDRHLFPVRLTRTADEGLAAAQRSALAKATSLPSLIVSVHVGDRFGQGASGICLFWDIPRRELPQTQSTDTPNTPVARTLAESLADWLRQQAGVPVHVYSAPLLLTTPEGVPVLLVEIGSIHHNDELARLSDSAYRDRVAELLTLGLAELVSKKTS